MEPLSWEEEQLIRNKLKKKLDPSRYEHTLGVSFTAAALAMAHHADIKDAQLAGLLHDCAKYCPESELAEKCRKHGVILTEEDILSPAVIHAKYGRYLAQYRYGIQDPDILNAICFHTTGRSDMSLLEKIVFIADYIEPNRTKASDLPEVRSLAFSDIDRCLYVILRDTIEYLRQKGSRIHQDTLQASDWLKKSGQSYPESPQDPPVSYQ